MWSVLQCKANAQCGKGREGEVGRSVLVNGASLMYSCSSENVDFYHGENALLLIVAAQGYLELLKENRKPIL